MFMPDYVVEQTNRFEKQANALKAEYGEQSERYKIALRRLKWLYFY